MIGHLYVWQSAVWLLLVRGEPFDRGPRRNVLLERLEPWDPSSGFDGVFVPFTGSGAWRRTGERVVRPFRGLRRWRPASSAAGAGSVAP